jgi:predicted RNA binding protein YcfA (HicA-like mRNA interferase family)
VGSRAAARGHALLRKAEERGEVVVPLHRELRKGTEAAILREAQAPSG